MPVQTQELLLVGSCNGWSIEAAKKSYCFSPHAVSDTVWQHEFQLQLDKTGEVEFQVISKADGWGWRLYPDDKDANRLVCGDMRAVKASLSLFEEDGNGQNFHLSEAAGSHVLIKILLSTHELLVWYEKAQAESVQTNLQQLQELPQHLQDTPPARWITVVWPYVPMRDKPDVSGKLVSVVKHGAHVEFEDLAPGRAVTLQDILDNRYLKVWSLGQDGSRQKTGWVCCNSDHGLHFAPFSDSADAQNALKPLLDADNVQAKQQQFEVTFQAQRNFKLNCLPRAKPPPADLPPNTADMILLAKHRLYAPVRGPFSHVTICGLPGGCASAAADWLRSKFDVEITLKSLGWLANKSHQEKVQQAGGGNGLLLLLLEEPLAWGLTASKGIGTSASPGCWATRLQRNEAGGPHELEYAPEGGAALSPGTAGMLHAPLLYEGCIHPDGVASVWSCSIHAAVAAITAAAVANVAILRIEDLLFRTSDLDAAFGDLVVARRRSTEDGAGPARANEDEGQLLHHLQSQARLSLFQPKAVAHLVTVTVPIRNAVGYGCEEELRRWSALARDKVGWLQEGEYCAFDPENKEDARQALEFLVDNGYVVFRSVAGKQELDTAEALLWEFLAQCGTGIKRGVPSSWAMPALSRRAGEAAKGQSLAVWPAEDGTGIISGNAIGQSAFMWHLRGLPRLRKAFGLIFGTDDLVSSFDGAGVFRPYGHDPSWRSRSTWYHVDQGDGMHGFHSVQGLVSLTAASAETGGLVVVPGSHLCHEELLERPESRGEGRLRLEEGDPALREWSKDAAGAVLVPLQPGDAVLWDSRTVHCSTHALREAPQEVLGGSRLLRAVGYVSMSPTAWATRETLARRMDVFQSSRRPLRSLTTTHNAHDLHVVREEPLGDTAAIELSDEQLELAIGRDGGLLSTCALDPGRPSFLPPSRYRCLANGAPVRTSPSTQRGDCIRGINGGMYFTAHRFGEWLRLDDSEWVQACHAEPDTAKPKCTPPPEDEEEEDLFEAAVAAAFG